MKQAWCDAIDTFEAQHNHGINKKDFAGVFGSAFLKAFTPNTVKAAFEKTGIYPFNPSVITSSQMKPSEPHSTQSHEALIFKQTSPIKAIVDAWRIPEDICEPATPTRHGISERDSNIDPSLYSPNQIAQQMQAALSHTRSGSFLVSSSPIRLSLEPPSPVINHALPVQHSSNEGIDDLNVTREIIQNLHGRLANANAQILLQNVQVKRVMAQAKALKDSKKKKKPGAKKYLADGRGRHITDLHFVKMVAQDARERVEREFEKRRKRSAAAKLHEEKAALEAQWQSMLKLWGAECTEWKELTDCLTAEGLPKSRHPKRPSKPRKPKLQSQFDRSSQSAEGSSSRVYQLWHLQQLIYGGFLFVRTAEDSYKCD
ncbi:hypothetical protein M422DRAFT_55216 [Sphaerobolus stellatus SS14]|uniref:Uncharacterized protein n=1 Tax=Sphaerobolus stellatus (strain SS14) TaxID=990650 RepID=A0A0C9UP50_SPHS4|nr:hypothetical protein M422DRAFT_55216 [Sphaerobolus stellatus SS14]